MSATVKMPKEDIEMFKAFLKMDPELRAYSVEGLWFAERRRRLNEIHKKK